MVGNKNIAIRKLFGWMVVATGAIVLVSEFSICRFVCVGDTCITTEAMWTPECVLIFTITGIILFLIGGWMIWKQKRVISNSTMNHQL